jgi:transcriptional regulator with XRE-family HTH domain
MSLGMHLYTCRLKIKHLKGTASLEEMARRVGCSKSFLSDVENNVSTPSLMMAAMIAKAYKTTLNRMVKEYKS